MLTSNQKMDILNQIDILAGVLVIINYLSIDRNGYTCLDYIREYQLYRQMISNTCERWGKEQENESNSNT